MQVQVKREIPEKTRWSAASSGMIPICENPGLAPLGIKPGSPSDSNPEHPASLIGGTPTDCATGAVRLLASHVHEPVSIPGGVAPGFSLVVIDPDDAAGRRVYFSQGLPPPLPTKSGNLIPFSFQCFYTFTPLHPYRLPRPRRLEPSKPLHGKEEIRSHAVATSPMYLISMTDVSVFLHTK
ncbi:hypothetical protein PR048_023248 [Dryococelus australis]|uniref:Uncharacterized protein n=1 Tax=Dryococelus australis TaxID=614101 RepID=A0ABQ9GTJ8_9NEOP|nr:hypothetical protein PR048_023248 [Dryococelus australis]